ncbi:general stress protein [Microbacterium sp. NPDC055683]
MSMMSGFGRTPEVGETVASFRDYDDALKAVSKLISSEIPAREIAIVGTALRSVERVTGRLGWAQAAWSGALNGVLLGLLLGAMVVIWSPALPMGAFVGLILLGVAMGMVFRLANYMIVRRRRDFASVMQVTADHYEVAVQRGSVGKARQVLGTAPVAPVRVDPADLTEPPRFGVRVDPRTGAPVVAEAPVAQKEPVAREEPEQPSTASGEDGPSEGDRA